MLGSAAWAAGDQQGLLDVLLTPVDQNCSHYATFQSHNQKVVSNDNGIFMTYLWEFDLDTWIGRWRLIHSGDGGRTFTLLYTSPPMGSNAPCIETDEDSNILLAATNYTHYRLPFYFYRFLAEKDYQNPEITTINEGASGKFAMFYDGESGEVYLFNHYGKLFVINATSGNVLRRREVVDFQGENATTQYPHVYKDKDGILHHAWTTNHQEYYLYWDIHYARSTNGGRTWTTANGTPLHSPFPPDHTGKADQIILPDEFEYHTWLSNMIIKDGKAHFTYLAQVPPGWRQHYVRLDLASGEFDKRIYPIFKGDNISVNGLDGFFATGPGSTPLYYVSRANYSHIGVIASYDNGDTWHDVAISDPIPNSIYSIGGFREVAPEGIIGSFTSQSGVQGDPYFFRIPVPEPSSMMAMGALAALTFLSSTSAPRKGRSCPESPPEGCIR
jgi:hypothetical protein